MFGKLRKDVGEILGKVCKMEGVTILKAATLPEHVHMYVSMPPKLNVSKTIGRIKGKSALIRFPSGRRLWTGREQCAVHGRRLLLRKV